MKRVIQVALVGAYMWFLTNYIMTSNGNGLWEIVWVRMLLYTVVPILIWENAPRLIPKKRKKYNNNK